MGTSRRFQARNGLDNNSLTLIGVATPVNTTDAANKAYADTKLALTGGTLSGQLTSTVATGTAPLVIASTTRVANLNVATSGTADTLTNARNINEVSFNGSANITVPRVRAIDDRTAAPADFTTAYATVGFGSWNNNNTSPYADYIAFRTYTDASGGKDNMVSFRKDAIGMRVWQQTYGSSTAFATFKDVAFTDSNITGSAATLTTTRTIWGQNFNGSANVTGSLTSVGNITGTGAVTLTATAGTLALVSTGANIITASTNGSERFRITSAGNVGVGTNAPSYLLDVAGTSRANSISITSQLTQVTPTGVGSSTGGTVPAGTYYATVEAYDINGFSSGYAAVSSGVTTTGTTSSIVWSWTAVPGAASYQIKFDTSPAGTFTRYASTTTNTYTLTVNISTLLVGFSASTNNLSGSISVIGGAQFGTQANVVSNYSTAILGITTMQNISAVGSMLFNHFGIIGAQGIQGFNQNHTTTPKELRIYNNFSSGDITFYANSGFGTTKIAQIDAANSCVTIFRQNGTSEGGQLNLAKSIDNSTAFFFDVFGSTSEPSLRLVSTKSGVGSVFEINSDGNIVSTCSKMTLTNATSRRIDFGTVGIAVPSIVQGSPSIGTKLVLYDVNSTAADADYGLGISFLSMWYSVPSAASHAFYTSNSMKFFINSSGVRATNGASIGYGIGSVATPVTQLTSRTTAVTSNGLAGVITMFSAVGSATWSSFTVNNTSVIASDTIVLSVRTGTNSTYNMFVSHVTANSFRINFAIVGTAGAADTPIINYTVLKNG